MKLINLTNKKALWLLSIVFLSCTNNMKFKKIEKNFEYAVYDDTCESHIRKAREFIDSFVYAYQTKCKEIGLNPKFYDSASLMNDNNISANYYLSKSREFMISIFNSDENTFRVYGSEFPVQFYLLQNPDYYYENINSSDGDKTKSFLHFYDTLSCVINIGIFTKITINNIAIETDSKFCHFKPNLDTPIFMFNGLTLMSKQLGTDTFNTFHIPKKGLSILCENNKIENYIFTAKIGGEFLANEEVKDLYLNSEYFREVLANEKLKPLASEILIKKERAIADQNFHYDFIEFKHDKEVLEKKIDSFNINIKAEDFFSDAKEKIRTGTLLWFYDILHKGQNSEFLN